MDAMHNIAVM